MQGVHVSVKHTCKHGTTCTISSELSTIFSRETFIFREEKITVFSKNCPSKISRYSVVFLVVPRNLGTTIVCNVQLSVTLIVNSERKNMVVVVTLRPVRNQKLVFNVERKFAVVKRPIIFHQRNTFDFRRKTWRF